MHSREDREPFERTVRICTPTDTALVLGSAQSETQVCRRAVTELGIGIVRRHSGGAAVVVEPGDICWIDVTIPRGDALWDDDVGRAFGWLGDCWVAALADLGIEGRSHSGRLVRTEWSPWVCFASLGPGEVTVDGAKAVGLSQRRSRSGAVFQGAVLLRWKPEEWIDLLALGDDRRARAVEDLNRLAVALPCARGDIENAFVAALP